jgi:hypothetical protein
VAVFEALAGLVLLVRGGSGLRPNFGGFGERIIERV